MRAWSLRTRSVLAATMVRRAFILVFWLSDGFMFLHRLPHNLYRCSQMPSCSGRNTNDYTVCMHCLALDNWDSKKLHNWHNVGESLQHTLRSSPYYSPGIRIHNIDRVEPDMVHTT